MSGEENIQDDGCKREPADEEEGAAPAEAEEAGAVATKQERDASEAPSVEITKVVEAVDDDAKMEDTDAAQEEAPAEEAAEEPAEAEEAPAEEEEETAEPEAEADAEPEPMDTEEPASEEAEPADEQPDSASEDGAEKRDAEEVTEAAAEEEPAQQQETAEDDAASDAPEGPQWQEVDLEQLKAEAAGPFAKTGGSNYFHALEDKFRAKLDDQYKNFANYTVFFTKVDNVQEAVNEVYGFDWNTEKNAKVLHTSQGFAYVAKPEFPSFREATADELAAIVAKEGADNVDINGSNYFHALEKKFREAVIKGFGAESTAFICWFNKTDNVEATVNGIYGSDWNQDENAKILHRSQGFAFVIQRVEEEE